MTLRPLLAGLLLMLPVQALDDSVRVAVQAGRTPWLERPMRLASNGARPLLAGGMLVAVASGAAGRAFALETMVALAPVNLVVEATKYAVDRARPGGAHRRTNAGFPSSHAANAFAVAIVLARRWRRAWLPAFALATLVAWSRIYLDRHWLSDVVAGAALGAALAWWAVEAWRAWRRARVPRPATAPYPPPGTE